MNSLSRLHFQLLAVDLALKSKSQQAFVSDRDLETDLKMRRLNKENALAFINTKYESRHNRHECGNGGS